MDEAGELRLRFTLAALLGVPVIAFSMVPRAGSSPPGSGSRWRLASVVVWVCGWPFHRAAVVNARHGASTMDTLVSMGVTVSYLWSLYALVFGEAGMIGMRHEFSLLPRPTTSGDIYLEVAVGVTVFLLLGRWLEARSKRSAGAALRSLLTLGAKDVSVLRDGVETRVPIGRLRVGERFLVRPGERIATDGLVVEGSSAVDALDGHRRVGAGRGRRGRFRRRRDGQRRWPAGRRGVVGRRGHAARADGAARRAGPGGQGCRCNGWRTGCRPCSSRSSC